MATRKVLSMLGSEVVGLGAILFVSAMDVPGQAAAQTVPGQQVSGMKIRMDIGGATISGTLTDSLTAREFASLLPLTVTLKDYAGTEKISDLPKRLSTEGAPRGFDPSVGDIACYAPWGKLAIFYRDFEYSTGLIKLGEIASGAATLSRPGSVQATITLAND